MSDPYIGEIRMFGSNFAPQGWALCNGQLLQISSNTALFSLLGTTYGGDGTGTFALPDLRGRVPMHWGNGPGRSNRTIGQTGGAETVQLAVGQMPSHTHVLRGKSGGGDESNPENGYMANSAATEGDLYAENADVDMKPPLGTGGNQAHNNVQPFQCVSYIIALIGIFPSES